MKGGERYLVCDGAGLSLQQMVGEADRAKAAAPLSCSLANVPREVSELDYWPSSPCCLRGRMCEEQIPVSDDDMG